MAAELCRLFIRHLSIRDTTDSSLFKAMHQAWPKLLRRIESGKAANSNEDRRLIVASRVWFCLYLFEHQHVVVDRRLIVCFNCYKECPTELGVQRY